MSDIITTQKANLTPVQFEQLQNVKPENEWLANIDSVQTRRAYESDIRDFLEFLGIKQSQQLPEVTRAHIITWRKSLELAELAPTTIRRKLAAISSLFNTLCESNAVLGNPVDGVKRPTANNNEGSTPGLGDEQARLLLEAPSPDTLKGLRDRAILATLLYHGMRRAELCSLRVKHLHTREGILHFEILGKGSKIRYIPAHPAAQRTIADYLAASQHHHDSAAPLFRPIKNPTQGKNLHRHLNPNTIYRHIVRKYAIATGIADEMSRIGPHSLRVTAATNAIEHDSDLDRVKDWLGHANIATTQLYNKRRNKPEDSPTFKVSY